MPLESSKHQGEKGNGNEACAFNRYLSCTTWPDLSSTIHKYLKQWEKKTEIGMPHTGASLRCLLT